MKKKFPGFIITLSEKGSAMKISGGRFDLAMDAWMIPSKISSIKLYPDLSPPVGNLGPGSGSNPLIATRSGAKLNDHAKTFIQNYQIRITH